MTAHPRQPGVMTLAQLLSSLSAGDPCPCCGAALQLGGSKRASAQLVCGACGCELEAEEVPFRAGCPGGYSLAA